MGNPWPPSKGRSPKFRKQVMVKSRLGLVSPKTQNVAQREANGSRLTLLCFIVTGFDPRGRQARTKTIPQLHSPSGSLKRSGQRHASADLVAPLSSSRDAGDLRASRLHDVCPPPDGGNSVEIASWNLPPSFLNGRRSWRLQIAYANVSDFTSQVLLGLQRSSFLGREKRKANFRLHLRPLTSQSHFAVASITAGSFSGKKLLHHRQPSLGLVAIATRTRQNGTCLSPSRFPLDYLCCYLEAFGSA